MTKAKTTKTCPKCNHNGVIATDFGMRWSKGKLIPQSWCIKCRLTESKLLNANVTKHSPISRGNLSAGAQLSAASMQSLQAAATRRLNALAAVATIPPIPEPLTCDREQVKRFYRAEYPLDKTLSRSWRFMVTKLWSKGYPLTKEAKQALGNANA